MTKPKAAKTTAGQLQSATARLKLAARTRPYFVKVASGAWVGYRKPLTGPGSWAARVGLSDGKGWEKTLWGADDNGVKADGDKILTFWQAKAKVQNLAGRKLDASIISALTNTVSLEQHIATKWSAFRDVDPACCLYRHYDSAGDLLYVGVSLSPLRRHEKHFAAQRYPIFQILIEPFVSREEALQAEERAIRDEYPKFNATHNRRRHPAFELRNIERATL